MDHPVKQLPVGLWGAAWPEPTEVRDFGLWGLWFGQTRATDIRLFDDARWYNAFGEQVGFGDLSKADILRIMAEIEEGCYLILTAADHRMGYPAVTPGIETVITHAELVITRSKAWWLHPSESGGQVTTRTLTFPALSYDEAHRLFLPLQAAEAT